MTRFYRHKEDKFNENIEFIPVGTSDHTTFDLYECKWIGVADNFVVRTVHNLVYLSDLLKASLDGHMISPIEVCLELIRIGIFGLNFE